MPFVALNKNTGRRVDITLYTDPRNELERKELICPLPDCAQKFMIKAGMIIRPHFAHYTECNSSYERHAESVVHLQAKAAIRDFLQEHFPAADVQLEVAIKGIHRVADVLITWKGGYEQAHECQLASITTEALEERRQDYLGAGMDVIWWLGASAASETNRAWCMEWQGICPLVQAVAFEEKQLCKLSNSSRLDSR